VTTTVTPYGVDHVAINVPDVPAAITFYTEVLGLTLNGTRPDFGFAGAWLDAGGQQVHLIELPIAPNVGQHFALLYEDLAAVVAELRGLGYEVSDVKPTSAGRLQAFISDPFGNGVELHQHDH
jgi:catechol 2,3-dioxygenase-like lactoylglutathione lyase family enzyme